MLLHQISGLIASNPQELRLGQLEGLIDREEALESPFARRVRNAPSTTPKAALESALGLMSSTQSRILWCGEPHDLHAHRALLADNISTLHESGIRTLGLEYFPHTMQKAIDNEDYPALERFLKENWEYSAQTIASILGLIRAAKGCGMRPVGLDASDEELEAISDPERRVSFRDDMMAGNALETAGEGKMLILCGAGHSGIVERLDDAGEKTTALVFLQSGRLSARERNGLENMARLCGRQADCFLLPSDGEFGGARVDLYLHLPTKNAFRLDNEE